MAAVELNDLYVYRAKKTYPDGEVDLLVGVARGGETGALAALAEILDEDDLTTDYFDEFDVYNANELFARFSDNPD